MSIRRVLQPVARRSAQSIYLANSEGKHSPRLRGKAAAVVGYSSNPPRFMHESELPLKGILGNSEGAKTQRSKVGTFKPQPGFAPKSKNKGRNIAAPALIPLLYGGRRLLYELRDNDVVSTGPSLRLAFSF